MATLRNTLVLIVACACAALGLIAPATAAAAGTPDISLDKHAPAQALLGTRQQVQLVASNPKEEKRGYNLTFRDVLPKNVKYVTGSAKVAPRVLENKPGVGMTTLIFENVSDLSANSEYELSYEVEPSTTVFKFTGEHVYTNKAEAFVSELPRNKARFNKEGEVEASSFSGDDTAEATTELTPIEIEKSEPSPEGEILRGVHEHQTVYTLKVRNNKVGPTQGVAGVGPGGKPAIVIEDWLPAGLEFLGCGNVDNTTDAAATNEGSAEEYPGSGAIDAPGNAPATTNCVEPFYVKTESVDPPGERGPGIYTHVKFLGPESLAKGAEYELQYVAAIPIHQNDLTWEGGPEPAAEGEGLKQIANLNNNNGPETSDEEELINVAQAHGVYEAVAVQDTDEMTRTAEDLAIQKSVNEPKISDGAESIWSLNLEASEYRRIEPVTITDQLPNGLCPRGPNDYEGPTGGPITQEKEECEASTTLHPSVKYLNGSATKKPGEAETIEYSLAEEDAEGGFKLEFNAPDVKALQRLEPSQELLITFPTTTRTFYQYEFEDSTPVLTGDSWVNDVKTQGTGRSRCTVEPNCEGVGAEPIVEEEAAGTPVADVSSASQQAGTVDIQKTVRETKAGLVPANCEGSIGEYVKGIKSETELALPQYRPGDEICWRLVVNFSAKIYAGTPIVSDFIPPDEEYVTGSEHVGPENTVHADFKEEGEALEWKITEFGEESVKPGQIFEYRFKTIVDTNSAAAPAEITGNLMKFLYSDTNGETFPLRDRAEVERLEPELSLEKVITEVGGRSVPRPKPGVPQTEVFAGGGEKVKYELDVENVGNLGAEEAEVWDVLPKGVKCADITLPTQTAPQDAKCEGDVIRWTGVVIPKSGIAALTYEMKVPTEVAPEHKFVNEAGVTHFASKTNTPAGKFEYFPEENINEELNGKANTGPLLDEAEIKTSEATLEKAATTESNSQPGNGPGQATIGELVDYTVTAKIPPNSKIFGLPVIHDVLPPNVELDESTLAGKVDEAALSTQGLTLESVPNGFEVRFNGAYPAAVSATGHVVVVTFKARVLNIAANERGVKIANHAFFEYEDVEEAGSPTVVEGSSETPVVEPNIVVRKKNLLPPTQETVAPGEVVGYESEVEDLAGASTANEVDVVDTVPPGMKVVGTPTPAATVAANTITWHFGSIAPGAVEILKYELEIEKPAKAASSFTNRVKATTQSLPEGEGGTPSQIRTAASGEAGYEAEAEDTVKLTPATVSKEVSRPKGTIGDGLVYTLHMTLLPQVEYFDTTMVDRLPDGVTFDKIAGSECKGEGCNFGEKIGATGAEVQPDGTTLVGYYFGDFAPGKARELVLRFNAHIDDVKSGGAKVKSGDVLTNKLVGLYNRTEVGKPTKVPTPGSSGFSEQTTEAEAKTTVVEPNVTLGKTVVSTPALEGGVAQAGSKLTYTLTVGNNGTSTAHEVEVVDTNTTANLRNIVLGAGAEHIKSSAGPLVWVLPEVEVGKPVTLTYTAELPPSSELENEEEVHNAAKVPVYFGLSKTEREAAKVSRQYEGPAAAANLEVALPEIEVVKTTGLAGNPDEGDAEVGASFPWRVVVKNKSSSAPAQATTVEDLLPPNWEYVPGSTEFKALGGATINPAASNPGVTGGTTQTLKWTSVAELPAEAAVEVLFEATPTVAAITHLPQQKNHAVGSFQDVTGAAGSAEGVYVDQDDAFAHLLWPELAIHKTPDNGQTVAGTPDHYVITVENGGTGPAHEVEVKDVLSKGQKFVGPAVANPPAGFAQKSVEEDTPGTGETTVIWTIAAVPKEKEAVVTIEVPIETEPSLNDGDHVTDLASVSSPQGNEPPPDEGSFEVHRETKLRIQKTAVEPSVNAGEDIHYEVEVENEGPSDATGIVVTDELPESTLFKSADTECAAAGQLVTCEFPELKVHEAHTFHLVVEVKSGITEKIVNTAEAEDDQGGGPVESTEETPIEGLANLAIEKTGPEMPVLLGNDFTYEIKVENEGPSDAVNATVEDPLPTNVKFLSATPSKGTCDAAPAALLTCDLERMLPHEEASIVVSVEAAEVGEFDNTATFDSDTSEPKEAEAHAEILPAADLAITKTAPPTVEPDGTLTYALHVEDLGPSDAHKVVVSDPLPAGVDFLSASEGCTAVAGIVTCAVQPGGELEAGGAADFQITVHVPFALGGQALVNTATVAGEEGDPHPEDNSSTVTTDVGPAADLAITKTMGKAQAGQPLTYTLAVTNKGPSGSSAVTVKDTLPDGTTFKSAAPSQGTCSAVGQAVTCQLGQLPSGGSAQVSITVEVAITATGSLRNAASVEGPLPDPDKSNNEAAVEGPVTPVPPTDPTDPADPNLKVVKTADTSTPQVGAPFAYHVDVTNMSGGEAKNVKVLDTLDGPVKVTSIEAESGKCGAAGSTITCTIPSIAVGKTVRITYTVVAESAGPLKNTVSAQAANGEKVPGNNRAVKSVNAKAAQAKYTLSKTASRKVVAGGKTVGFTITLRNGFAAMTDAKICDRLPSALVFVKAAGARYVNGEACWTKSYVAAHKVLKLHLVARAVKGLKTHQVRNVATASAANATRRSASVAVRIKAAFAGKPGGVTG